MFLDTPDHLAVDEGLPGSIFHFELDAPGLAHQLHLEIPVAIEDFLGVVALAAGIHHGQRALAKQWIETAGARIEQFLDFGLRQVFEAAARSDAGIHEVRNDDAGFQGNPLDPSRSLADREVYSTGERRDSYGSMSIGTLSDVIIQISTMSALVTAMQPSVQ